MQACSHTRQDYRESSPATVGSRPSADAASTFAGIWPEAPATAVSRRFLQSRPQNPSQMRQRAAVMKSVPLSMSCASGEQVPTPVTGLFLVNDPPVEVLNTVATIVTVIVP